MAACVPTPTSPPVDDPTIVMPDGASRDAAFGTRCERVCQRYIELSCPEGRQTRCVEGCEVASTSPAASFDPDCVLGETTRDGVRKCGVRCPP